MNAAFDAALAAGGAIDTSVGVPKSREDMFEFYGFIRNQANDAESKKGEGGLAMPAGYMFKEPPGWDADELGDPVELLIAAARHHDGPAIGRQKLRPGLADSAAAAGHPGHAFPVI